jgi:hypothetical protein
MSLLQIEGFDYYAIADITKRWIVPGTNYAVLDITSVGRRGGKGLSMKSSSGGSSSSYITKVLQNENIITVGLAMSFSVAPDNAAPILQLFEGAGACCSLKITNLGVLYIAGVAGTALPGGTSSVAIPIGSTLFSYVEVTFKIGNSLASGDCKIFINNVETASVTSGDTQAGSNAYATSLCIGMATNYYTATIIIDDIYIKNDATMLGDSRVDALYPTSDGNYTDFTPSTGGSHFALVDETAPNTTDYNSSSTAGHRDSYGMENLAALSSQVIHGVQVNGALLKSDAGIRTASVFVRSGSTNSDGTTVGLSTSQVICSHVFELNPDTGTAWTESTVNAMEAGVRVVA